MQITKVGNTGWMTEAGVDSPHVCKLEDVLTVTLVNEHIGLTQSDGERTQ